MQGAVLDEQSPAYEEARTIWNAMIDHRPALIAQRATAADVAKAVGFSRSHAGRPPGEGALSAGNREAGELDLPEHMEAVLPSML